MLKGKVFLAFCFVLVCAGVSLGAPIILNEYNAVGPTEYLGADGSDSSWGRVEGNGGDWFELVVIQDHLNMQDWKFSIDSDTTTLEVLNLTNHSIWSDLRSGTIITISESEDIAEDVSYNPIYDPHDPAAGDWWINVRANKNYGTGTYIEKQNFPVNNDNWQLTIKDLANAVIFGPVGEGIISDLLVGKDEIFRLEADPSALITPFSNYDDDKNLSTFGAPNRWGGNVQDFSQLRSAVPEPATILLFGLGGLVLRKRR